MTKTNGATLTRAHHSTKALFDVGRTVATPGALELLQSARVDPSELLRRHSCGDWGELLEVDLKANEHALKEGYRLMSVYPVGLVKVWVITEADRSSTTILRPEDY
jgi:hypothetical protein